MYQYLQILFCFLAAYHNIDRHLIVWPTSNYRYRLLHMELGISKRLNKTCNVWTRKTAACFYCKLTVVINNNYQHSVGIMILSWALSFKVFLFVFYCDFLEGEKPNNCQSNHYIQPTFPSKTYLQLDLHCFYKFIKNMCCPVPGIATANADTSRQTVSSLSSEDLATPSR